MRSAVKNWYVRAQSKPVHYGRLTHEFQYHFFKSRFIGNGSYGMGWNNPKFLKDVTEIFDQMNGKKFLIHFTADYYEHGAYEIKPYRPIEDGNNIPEVVWEIIRKDIAEQAKEAAFEKLDKVRDEKNPVNIIVNQILEE